jgi:endonuclease/exonuclease/phosphatase family metal-dependent hydrolase
VVGLIEAIDENVVEQLATSLYMEYRLSGRAKDAEGWQGAVLSRLPIISTRTYTHSLLKKQPLLEVCLEEHDGQLLTVFVTHLTAAFSRFWIANQKRRCEVRELLRIMEGKQGTKHLLMGDFNSIAPGEQLRGSSFLQYVADPNLYFQLEPDPAIQAPNLDFVLPRPFYMVKPLLEMVPRSKILSTTFDAFSFLYAPRGGFRLLNKAGYVDCFREMNPGQQGFTWPAPLPVGRVDFIFASPELSPRLFSASVLTEDDHACVGKGSDHLPIFADFCD